MQDPKPQLPPPQAVKELIDLLSKTRNVILYGPPGTGKTWLVRQLRRHFLANNATSDSDSATTASKDWRHYAGLVTFHQSFAYEGFVEGLKPVVDRAGNVTYPVVPGVFRRICERAEEAWQTYRAQNRSGEGTPRYLLLIDEINRANIARVFGELITLVENDKRLGSESEITLTLPYSGERFGVPPNLYIVGTMNTADRSIALLDLALRRRFAFKAVAPQPSLLRPVQGLDLSALLTNLNERIAALLDSEHMIGHSYLMGLNDAASLHFAWYNHIVPLLEEYFYGDGERLRAVVGAGLVEKWQPSSKTTKALGDLYDAGMPRYRVRVLTPKQLLIAMAELATGSAEPDMITAPIPGA